MRKMGFTLIEVLAVVAILGILLAVTVPSIANVFRKVQDDAYELLIDTIEDSARLYTNRNRAAVASAISIDGFYEVTVLELINSGILKSDLVDPRTKTVIEPTKRVIITHDANLLLIYCFEDRECSV